MINENEANPIEVEEAKEVIDSNVAENKKGLVMLSIRLPTKERIYRLKLMDESWDAVLNRILDKVVADGDSKV
jgi:hypothetical protein